MITNPKLPPKAGYVEVVDENGTHKYEPTKEMKKKLEEDARNKEFQNAFTSLVGSNMFTLSSSTLEFRKAVQLFASTLTEDASMMEIASVYPKYQTGVSYKIGDIFSYGTNPVGDPQLYQVLQAHVSAAEWTPDSAVSLYKKVGISEDGTPIWVQPLGATDAYNTGDQVMYNGKKYESLINANVWSLDAYPAGWKEVTDTDPTTSTEPTDPDEPSGDNDVPEFVQPSGTTDAYNTGDQVMYNGKKYESLIDANTWSPDAYPTGWKLIEE